MNILVTNNPLVQAQYQDDFRVIFLDTDLIGVLTHTRDKIHNGHQLLTHPLSGSLKPNESPYKSVLLTEEIKQPDPQSKTNQHPKTDTQSVTIIEESIITAKKFPQKTIPEEHLKDMQTVDLSLIRAALG